MLGFNNLEKTNSSAQAGVHEGLRAHMLSVYNYMALGLGVTAAVAYAFYILIAAPDGGLTQLGQTLFQTPLKWVVMLAPLGLVLTLSFGINKFSTGTALLLFWLYAAANGLSFSTIGISYSGASIATAFLTTSITFGAMSLWGYVTKRDLTRMGSFLMMGLMGVIVASLVNLFFQSSALQFALSLIGLFIFIGLTAYDTQKIRDLYFETQNDSEATKKSAIFGALTLYMDFINIFLYMLQFMRGNDK